MHGPIHNTDLRDFQQIGHSRRQFIDCGPGALCRGRNFGKTDVTSRIAAKEMSEPSDDLAAYQRRWHDYYSEKRIVHQWMQVHLLDGLPVKSVLEIGPYMGLVTALLENAGYRTTTLDVEEAPRAGLASQATSVLLGDVRSLGPELASGEDFDAILCCETLEHIPYEQVGGVLDRMVSTGIRYLILSVPYMGSQLTFQLYLNGQVARKYTSLKKFMGFKTFADPDGQEAWEPHKWEIGYRNYPLSDFRDRVAQRYRILRTEFTAGCRSVFLVCENPTAI